MLANVFGPNFLSQRLWDTNQTFEKHGSQNEGNWVFGAVTGSFLTLLDRRHQREECPGLCDAQFPRPLVPFL